MINFKELLPTSIITSVVFTGISISASAEMSANVGYASEYYFRGILQKQSSASAGLDFEQDGFYAGTWTADVGDGLEVDLYGGYNMEIADEVSVGLGVAGYFYTGDTFDDTYEEVNLSAGWGPLSIGYSFGKHDNLNGNTDDYDFLKVTLEGKGFHGTVGSYGGDFNGEYLELGYDTTVGEFDIGITAIFNSDEISTQVDSNGNPTEGQALVFTLGKSFDL